MNLSRLIISINRSRRPISQRRLRHVRSTQLKPRPNDCNMPTQQIATLLGATCCVRLATVLRCIATCWVWLPQGWKWSNLSQQHPTPRNMSHHGGQTHAACVAIYCVGMLRSFGRGFIRSVSDLYGVQIRYVRCIFKA